MKSKAYRHGPLRCRSQMRNAGFGYEVSFYWGTKPIFVSNFTRSSEANQWWTALNREVKNFAKKYRVAPTFPKAQYGRFLSNHLYNRYFAFLDKVFAKHSRSYNRAFNRDARVFRRISARPNQARSRQVFLKAA